MNYAAIDLSWAGPVVSRVVGTGIRPDGGFVPFGYTAKDMIPKDILQNNDVTVFFWNDGTKTVVKREEETPDSLYYAYCCAMAKRMFGSTGKVDRVIEKIEKRKKKERELKLEIKRAKKEKKLIEEHRAAKRAAKKAARESKTQVVRKLNDIDRKLDGVLLKR